jgi:hypothetical protein
LRWQHSPSTIFFSFPGGIDAAVIIRAARGDRLRGWRRCCTTVGSVGGGAALTFWMGAKIGAHGLERYMPAGACARPAEGAQHGRDRDGSARSDPSAIPVHAVHSGRRGPKVDVATFFTTLAVCRLIRFGLEALLAAIWTKRSSRGSLRTSFTTSSWRRACSVWH